MTDKAINVAAAVVIHNKKVLLAKRRGGYLDNLWEFPGGKLEENESAKEAAKRELHEELNITVEPLKTLLILEHDYPDKRVRLHFVKCAINNNSSDILSETLSNDDVAWFTPANIPFEQCCPADKIAAKQLPWSEII